MSNQVSSSENPPDELSLLFAAYREACPDNDGSANFLPDIWRKIERRQSFWFSFEQFARRCAAVAVAVCLLLVALNIAASRQNSSLPGGYVDALAAVDHSAERTYYAEGVAGTVQDTRVPDASH